MMVSIDKVKRGLARYLDEEFTNKMTGWQKWVFGVGAAMFLENLTSISQTLKRNPMVEYISLMDESGGVAVERIHQQLRIQAQKGPVTFDVPMLGSITLHESDVEKLYNYIMQA